MKKLIALFVFVLLSGFAFATTNTVNVNVACDYQGTLYSVTAVAHGDVNLIEGANQDITLQWTVEGNGQATYTSYIVTGPTGVAHGSCTYVGQTNGTWSGPECHATRTVDYTFNYAAGHVSGSDAVVYTLTVTP